MSKPFRSVVFDRTLFKDHPNLSELPGIILWDVCSAIDNLLRVYGVTPIVWEVHDDGVVLEVVPFFPSDCAPEARLAADEYMRAWKRAE